MVGLERMLAKMKNELNKSKKRFEKIWYAPPDETTIMNWEGLFKERSFMETLSGLGEWRRGFAESFKKQLGDFIWSIFETELIGFYKLGKNSRGKKNLGKEKSK